VPFHHGAFSLPSHQHMGPTCQAHPLPPLATQAARAVATSHHFRPPCAAKLGTSRCCLGPFTCRLESPLKLNPLGINGVNPLNADCCHLAAASPHHPLIPIKGGNSCRFSLHHPLLFLPSLQGRALPSLSFPSPLPHHRRLVTTPLPELRRGLQKNPRASLSLFRPCRRALVP
jgi:hypothetical protein